jgi:HEAT repeat protein
VLDGLVLTSLVLTGISAVLVLVLCERRVRLARAERNARALDARLVPRALALLEGETVPPVAPQEGLAFASIVGRIASRLAGSPVEYAAAFFEAEGHVARALAQLGDRRPWRRASAAFGLGDMGSPGAVPALLDALDDPVRDVRSAAARSLGRLRAVEAVDPLVHALAYKRTPRAVAGYALLSIGPPALPRLRPMLSDDHAEIRAAAVELIGLLGNASVAGELGERLRDGSAEVRAKAAHALGRLAAEREAGRLRETLNDRAGFVRAAAAEALGLVGDRDAGEELLAVAREDDFDPARAAARAFARLRPDAVFAAASAPGAGPHLAEASDLLATLK